MCFVNHRRRPDARVADEIRDRRARLGVDDGGAVQTRRRGVARRLRTGRAGRRESSGHEADRHAVGRARVSEGERAQCRGHGRRRRHLGVPRDAVEAAR